MDYQDIRIRKQKQSPARVDLGVKRGVTCWCIALKGLFGLFYSVMGEVNIQFAWYIDITPNEMFSLYDYPIPGKNGLPLCQEHGKQLEMKEVVVLDQQITISRIFSI
jgi:hypothetical protein